MTLNMRVMPNTYKVLSLLFMPGPLPPRPLAVGWPMAAHSLNHEGTAVQHSCMRSPDSSGVGSWNWSQRLRSHSWSHLRNPSQSCDLTDLIAASEAYGKNEARKHKRKHFINPRRPLKGFNSALADPNQNTSHILSSLVADLLV